MGRDIRSKYTTWHNPELKRSEFEKSSLIIQELYQKLKNCYLQKKISKESFNLLTQELLDFNFTLNKVTPTYDLNNLILPITSTCNLNCKGCTSYSPLEPNTPENKAIYSLNQIISDLSCLKQKGFTFREVSIEGGEPLLHPELFSIISSIRKLFNESTVLVIQTNGLLLNNWTSEEYQKIAEAQCQIIISKYLPKQNFEKFISLADQYKIEYKINQCYSKQGYFYLIRGLEDKQALSEATQYSLDSPEMLRAFVNCEKSHSCITLRNGYIYPCSHACHLPVLNKCFNLSYPETYYNIYELTGEEIKLKLAKPCPSCQSCLGTFFDYQGRNWEKSEKDPQEWIAFDPFKN